jgi:hypothetical protein
MNLLIFIWLDEDDYVDQIKMALEKYNDLQLNMTRDAKKWVQKFSNQAFIEQFIRISSENYIL